MPERSASTSRLGFVRRLLEKREKLSPARFGELLLETVQERDLYADILAALPEGILLIDQDEVIQYANQTARDLLALEDDLDSLRPVQEILPPDLLRALQRCLHRRDSTLGLEVTTTAGPSRLVSLACLPTGNANNPEALVVLRDITHVRMEELSQLRQSQLARMTHLAAGLAHEISNPLNSLSIYVDLLRREVQAEPSREKLLILREELDRLKETLQRFLRAVRPSKPNMDIHALESVLTGTLELLRPELEQSAVQVEYVPPSPALRIRADVEQLRGALVNLCRNAMQSMPGGGRLEIKCQPVGRMVEVSITDSGTGISPENLERIFEPYFTTREEGTGLGLAEVDRIVREHDGTVRVSSQPGEGTCFAVSLPLYRPHHHLPHKPAPIVHTQEDD